MATVISFNTAKSDVISALQASRTPYSTTVDGSNAQYSSDVEIANAILNADAEICNAIINTPESPYLTTFVQTSGALASGASLPARNGIILKVQCLDTSGNVDWSSGDVNQETNLISIDGTNVLVSGAGTTAINGVYTARGVSNSRPYYNLSGHSDSTSNYAVVWDGAEWNITNSSGVVQYDGINSELHPWTDLYEVAAGASPAPAVSAYPVNASLILITGLKVQLTTAGSLPSGLALATDYYIVVSGGKYGFATSLLNAFAGTLITLGSAGSGTSTINAQYVDGLQAKTKDQVLGVNSNPQLYGASWPNICGWWFIENDEVVTTSPTCKVIYSDFTLTSSPQAPEPLLNPVVAGAIGHLAKDGGDEQLAGYYLNLFGRAIQQIMSGGMVVPAITSYQAAQAQPAEQQ